jgi:chromosome segregation ATPase
LAGLPRESNLFDLSARVFSENADYIKRVEGELAAKGKEIGALEENLTSRIRQMELETKQRRDHFESELDNARLGAERLELELAEKQHNESKTATYAHKLESELDMTRRSAEQLQIELAEKQQNESKTATYAHKLESELEAKNHQIASLETVVQSLKEHEQTVNDKLLEAAKTVANLQDELSRFHGSLTWRALTMFRKTRGEPR